jgi:hypothetical protein
MTADELPGLVLGVGDGLGFGGSLSPATIALADGLDAEIGGFELRLHGVGGSSAAQILDGAESVQVGGDSSALFIRRHLPAGTAGQSRRPWPLEGYWWGGLTRRSVVRALWVLVFPLMLCNVASWMLPSPGARPSRRRQIAAYCLAIVMRLAGFALTMLLTASLATASLDVFGWQCGMLSAPGPGNHGKPATCLPTWLHWVPASTGPRLSVFVVVPVLVLAGMGIASLRTLGKYERWQLPPDLKQAARKSWPLAAEGFWHGLRPVRRQLVVHLAGAAGLLTVYLATAASSHPGWRHVAFFGGIGYVALAAAVLIAPQTGRPGVNPHSKAPPPEATGYEAFDWAVLGLLALAAASLASITVARIWWQPVTPAHGPPGLLPGDSRIWLIVSGALAALLVLSFALTALAENAAERRRDKAFAAGFFGPATLALSMITGGVLAGGLALLAPKLLLYNQFKRTIPALQGFPGFPAKDHLVLPSFVFDYTNALLVIVIAALLLGVVGLFWLLCSMCKTMNAASLWKLYGGDAVEGKATRSQRRAIGIAWSFGKIADFSGLVVVTLGVTGIAGAVVLGWILREPHPAWVITATQWGQWVGVALAGLLLALTRQAFSSGGTRRAVGTIWDIGTFWPRASQPLAPPSYMERSVPEVVNRLRRAVGDRARPDLARDPATDEAEQARIKLLLGLLGSQVADRICLPAQGWVVVNGYSQGSAIAAAVIAQLPADVAAKISLVTVGSPLRRLYGRAFPAYFGQRCMLQLANVLGAAVDGATEVGGPRANARELARARWRNARRPSDYIGSYIFYDPLKEAVQADGKPPKVGLDQLILDPPRLIPAAATAPPVIHEHSDFWPDPQVVLMTEQIEVLSRCLRQSPTPVIQRTISQTLGEWFARRRPRRRRRRA